MCLAISTVSKDESVELTFVFERIYLDSNSSATISVDLLIKNICQKPINRLRISLPYALVHIPEAKRSIERQEAVRKFQCLCEKQISRVILKSHELTRPDADCNWAYRSSLHTRIHKFEAGLLTIRREPSLPNSQFLAGYIKNGWLVTSPLRFHDDPWLWFLCAANEITVVDLVVPDTMETERILPGEMAWFRIEFTVPGTGIHGINKHYWWEKILRPSLRFIQVFMSPVAVSEWIVNQIRGFNPREIEAPEEIIQLVLAVQGRAQEYLAGEGNEPEVRDWRTLLYLAPNLTLDLIKQGRAEPFQPHTLFPKLPAAAYRWTSRPIWAPRSHDVFEFWIGSDIQRSNPDGYVTYVWATWRNIWYEVMRWLGFIGFILAVYRLIWP